MLPFLTGFARTLKTKHFTGFQLFRGKYNPPPTHLLFNDSALPRVVGPFFLGQPNVLFAILGGFTPPLETGVVTSKSTNLNVLHTRDNKFRTP